MILSISILLNAQCKNFRRQAFSMSELFHDQPEVPHGHEFSSREICSDTVNPTPNPKDDDKISFKLTNLEEETHREVLYLHSTNHSDSFIKDTFVLRNLFLLAASRERSPDNHRSPFRQYPQSRERNSEVDELLSDSRTPEEDRGMKRDPEENHIPLNNYGSSLSSRLRRINAVTVRCTDIVKLTNSVANPSCNPARAINSEVLRRKPEELSRDSLLLPREEVVAAERSPLESRGSGRAVKKNAFSRFNKITGGSDAKKWRYQQPRVEKRSRIERDVSAGMIRPFLPRLQRLRQQMLYKNRLFFPISTVEMRARQGDDRIRAAKSAPSLSVGRFIENYENSTSESVKDSRLTVLQARQLSLRSLIITVFRMLGIFVQVGRQVIDVVESNAILACTKEYLMTKIIRWIDA